jgi:hypothetical protein
MSDTISAISNDEPVRKKCRLRRSENAAISASLAVIFALAIHDAALIRVRGCFTLPNHRSGMVGGVTSSV